MYLGFKVVSNRTIQIYLHIFLQKNKAFIILHTFSRVREGLLIREKNVAHKMLNVLISLIRSTSKFDCHKLHSRIHLISNKCVVPHAQFFFIPCRKTTWPANLDVSPHFLKEKSKHVKIMIRNYTLFTNLHEISLGFEIKSDMWPLQPFILKKSFLAGVSLSSETWRNSMNEVWPEKRALRPWSWTPWWSLSKWMQTGCAETRTDFRSYKDLGEKSAI